MIRFQLTMISAHLNLVIQAKVSLNRIDGFLRETELLDAYKDTAISTPIPPEHGDVIGFKNTTFAWSEEFKNGILTPSRRSFKLKIDGELLFKNGCINLITGPT